MMPDVHYSINYFPGEEAEELHAELEKGYADMKAGRTKDAKTVFADIRKNYGL